MVADDSIRIRVGMTGGAETAREGKKVARAIDEIGDQARQSARQVARLNKESASTRVNLGPFSTSVRGGALAIGALVNAGKAGIPVVLSLAEAAGVVAVGGGAAGGVGLTGLAQAAGVAKLGLGGLQDALGGNQAALKKLSPEVRALFDQLHGAQTKLQGTAQQGLLPGLEAGTQSAMRNLPVVNRLVGRTARVLGSLAQRGGNMLGSAQWAEDIKTLGGANVHIIDDLGTAGLHLAGAFKDVLVSAAPLAKWLAKNADEGARLLEVWIGSERASGGMARFFREAQTDMRLLAQIGSHSGRGLINIFGSQDVNGTQTLASINKITMRFEQWTRSGALDQGFGQALADQAPKLGGAIVGGLATGMARAAPTAVSLFWNAFWDASTGGKFLTAGFIASKLGVFKGVGKLLGGGALGGAAGASLKRPVPVFVVNEGFGGGPGGPGRGLPGKVGKLGRFAPLLRVGVPAAIATGAALDARHLINDVQRQRAADAGLSPEQIRQRAARVQQGFRPLSGESVPSRVPNVDAQGFPTGGFRDEVHVAPVYLDAEKVGTITARVRRRRQASN
jgi:hypothetical protein